ncbi:MAG: hypothetical protein K8I29_03235 [Alphaproteobacteria bacterium]|uniref:Uncharacterized protein n=1 Tax=Candidatus Nitrobium versatile TaxID=2884831 RepID=A0A953J8I6_9BACT|nr:hypothetical protein [Candidatus Nitrobium versatile]
MTKILVNPGACGLPAKVDVKKENGEKFSVTITSQCKMVAKLGEEIQHLTMKDAFTRLLENPVYKKGATCLRHVACPVPSGILKALEVEAGLNVPKDVSISFIAEEKTEEGGA